MTESRSLWNFASSPGWTDEELEILKLALMKFGVGRWKRIVDSRCLPNKTVSQMYMQTQRLLGQQSLCEFMGLNVNIDLVKADNLSMAEGEVFRKQGLIINNNIDYNRKAKLMVRQANAKRYGLSREEISQIEVPRMATTNSLKDLVNWRKYFRKHKPSLLMRLEKLNQFIEDCDLYIEAKRMEIKRSKLFITIEKKKTRGGEIQYVVKKLKEEDEEGDLKEQMLRI